MVKKNALLGISLFASSDATLREFLLHLPLIVTFILLTSSKLLEEGVWDGPYKGFNRLPLDSPVTSKLKSIDLLVSDKLVHLWSMYPEELCYLANGQEHRLFLVRHNYFSQQFIKIAGLYRYRHLEHREHYNTLNENKFEQIVRLVNKKSSDFSLNL